MNLSFSMCVVIVKINNVSDSWVEWSGVEWSGVEWNGVGEFCMYDHFHK